MEILTHEDGTDRRWRICQCGTCMVVARCEPRFDFYSKANGDPLQCESCFRIEMAKQGRQLANFPAIKKPETA